MKYLANIVSVLTIFGFVYAGYSQLATKQDLKRISIISNFKWAELSISINELRLVDLDKIKLIRDLKPDEVRAYKAYESSIERITQIQEKTLEAQTLID